MDNALLSPIASLQKDHDTPPDMREEKEDCDQLDSVSLKGDKFQTGVTSLVNEGCTEVEIAGGNMTNTSVLSAGLQDLKDYLSRPRLIYQGVLPTGVRTSAYRLAVTNYSLRDTIFPQLLNRIRGVYGMRMSLHFVMQINATPFHAGLLCMSWQYETDRSSAGPNGGNVIRSRWPAFTTNLPHVRADLSAQTMVQLKVPYLNSLQFIQLRDPKTDDVEDIGTLDISTLSIITLSAGQTAPTIDVMCYLEDIEFFGASPESVVFPNVQAGKIIQKEVEEDAKPISGGLSLAGKFVKLVTKNIPAISSYGATAAWFLERASGAAKAFGFSKPQILDPTTRVLRQANAFETNVDVPAATMTVGPYAGNRVMPYKVASDIDEMALSYVLGQYGQLALSDIRTSDTHGQTVYVCPICPSAMYWHPDPTGNMFDYPNTNTWDAILPTHIYYWSSLFHYWAGSFRFRFTFAKTKFHTGRYMCTYTPSYQFNGPFAGTVDVAVPGPVTDLLSPFGYSAIFDLRDDNVFEFVVPYTSNSPHRTFWECTGTIALQCINPLLASAVVPNVVNVLVEVKAEPDFVLTVPGGVYRPVNPSPAQALQSGEILFDQPHPPTELQAGIISHTSDPAHITNYTVGEITNSVKQLFMIPTSTGLGEGAPSSVTDIVVSPWYALPGFQTAPPTPAAAQLLAENFSVPAYAAHAYQYVNGSTEAHVYLYSKEPATKRIMAGRYGYPEAGFGRVSNVGDQRNPSLSSVPKVIEREGYAHFRFPSYSKRDKVPVYDEDRSRITTKFGASAISGPPEAQWNVAKDIFYRIWVGNAGNDPYKGEVAICGGDDAVAYHYLGPNPLWVSSLANEGTVYDTAGLFLIS